MMKLLIEAQLLAIEIENQKLYLGSETTASLLDMQYKNKVKVERIRNKLMRESLEEPL